MGFFDALMSSSPVMQKAQAVISLGLIKRREATRQALIKLRGQPGLDGVSDEDLDQVLAASSHGAVIREIAKATGVDLLRTLADRLEAKPDPKPGF